MVDAQLKEQFALFAKFGESKNDGSTITLKNADKWFKQAGVIAKKITTTDTGIAFNKFKGKTMNFDTFLKYLDELSSKMAVEEIKEKLVDCGAPGTQGATKAVKSGGVDRLTDASQYTGAHRERFDAEGRGRGREGRDDIHENSGYVGNYKGKDTYDKTH
ncbi:tubulin polymerization-promoting protein homolog [Neocloeon triangulifer]|uniref:tubulin polymerization-promoting protein homolog n=1 Tax=Neocloeon triangulifer TaxID=2078957 RepID=UPI00286EB522|nr:tubulin polymerization-promoting protein homolog [Neocloeon triangulifer]